MQGSSAPVWGGAWSVVIDPQQRQVRCGSHGCIGPRRPARGAPLPRLVLSHLAEHARREQPPAHLRTCCCHSGGCRWHGRGPGCGGEVSLVVFRRSGGRAWHLANVCRTCAGSIPQAAPVPSPADGPEPVASGSVARRRRGGGEARGETQQRAAVRAALGYTAASLPAGVSAEARLLAVVCALRVRRSGWAPLPGGLVRSLRLSAPVRAVGELTETGWLEAAQPGRCGPGVWVAELAGRPGGLRAGQWALRMLARPGAAALEAPGRLAALAMAAWAEGPGEPFVLGLV